MKSYHTYYKLIFLIFFFILFLTSFLKASENIEEELKEITEKLRCMTCQNQSIYDSDADFSKDIKKIIRQKLGAGKSKKEINNFLVQRYGEYILLKPKFDKKNLTLWLFPFILLILSLILLLIKVKKTR